MQVGMLPTRLGAQPAEQGYGKDSAPSRDQGQIASVIPAPSVEVVCFRERPVGAWIRVEQPGRLDPSATTAPKTAAPR